MSKGSITQEQASNQIFAFEFGPKSEFTFDKFYKEKMEELETKLGREDEALDKLKKYRKLLIQKLKKKTKKTKKNLMQDLANELIEIDETLSQSKEPKKKEGTRKKHCINKYLRLE